MKHLKDFKIWEADGTLQPGEFSSYKDLTIPHYIQLELLDRSLDLKDEGFKVQFQWWPPYIKSSGHRMYEANKYPYISITKPLQTGYDKIWYMTIKDFCEEIGSYLNSEGYNITIKYRKEETGDYLNVKDTEENWGPFSNYPMCHSINYKIEMIDRNIWGDVTE